MNNKQKKIIIAGVLAFINSEETKKPKPNNWAKSGRLIQMQNRNILKLKK